MAELHRDVLRLDEAAEAVQHLEGLADLQEVAEVLEAAGAFAAHRIHDVGRSGGRREHHMLAPHRHVELRLGGAQHDLARRHREALLDEAAVETDGELRLVHLAAAAPIGFARFRQQHPHALVLEQLEGARVDGGDLIVGEDLERLERIDEMPIARLARRCVGRGCCTCAAARSPIAGGRRGRISHGVRCSCPGKGCPGYWFRRRRVCGGAASPSRCRRSSRRRPAASRR